MRVRWSGFATVAVTLVVLATSCEGEARRPEAALPVVGERSFAALWPEQLLVDALATQAAVDAGDPSMTWRTDAGSTAARFATTVLGWQGPSIVKDERWRLPSGVEIARVWLCDAGGCPDLGAAYDEEVILKRFAGGGTGGVWSVTDVTSGRLLLEQAPDIRIREPTIRAGRKLDAIALEGGLPDGARVVAGSATLGPCGSMSELTTTTVRFSRVRFQVGTSLDRGCAKVVRPSPTPGFVFVVPMQRGAPAEPESWFTAGREEGAAPLLDLTAMAVMFVPRQELPNPPPSWRSRDPLSLPTCRPEHLAMEVGAGRAVPGFGVGIFVEVHRTSGPACHAAPILRLALFDAHGERIAVPGTHSQVVAGYLPGYVPGTRALYAGWALFHWCGRDRDGPIAMAVRSPGLVARAQSDHLARWCQSDGSAPQLDIVALDPTP